MDKTANYNLPQWVGTDPIRMKPFNDAFDGIDAALNATTRNPSRLILSFRLSNIFILKPVRNFVNRSF